MQIDRRANDTVRASRHGSRRHRPRSELGESSGFQACAADDERVAAAGSQGADGEGAGLLSVHDGEGVELWTIVEPSLLRMTDVAVVGLEFAVTGVGLERTAESDDTKLLRYDENGALRWSRDLPEDGELYQRGFGVIADGGGGTWAFGEAASRPYAVHHDRDGHEIEVLDCIGGISGWVLAAAVDPERRLSLGIQLNVQTPTDESHAWFPTIEDGVVVRAATFSNDSENSAGPLAVVWRDDGALVLGWGRYGEEGGGYSEIVALPP